MVYDNKPTTNAKFMIILNISWFEYLDKLASLNHLLESNEGTYHASRMAGIEPMPSGRRWFENLNNIDGDENNEKYLIN